MRSWIRPVIRAVGLVAVVSGSVSAQTLTNDALLNGGSIMPAKVVTGAVGLAEFTIDATGSNIPFEVNLFNLSTRVTGVHIHVGANGVVGPILFDLRASSQSGDIDLKGSLVAADVRLANDLGIRTISDAVESLAFGGTYIDVHTERNPDGEIRGQIIPTDYAEASFRALAKKFFRIR